MKASAGGCLGAVEHGRDVAVGKVVHEAQYHGGALLRWQLLQRRDASAIRRLVAALAEPFRETFVLREIQNLSYREIADVAEVPVGTVMSRLARARAMLRSAWMAEQEPPK